MSKKKTDAKLIMLEHSKAKVELYTTYLAKYLNILSRVTYLDRIHLYDLMCGEGIYLDDSKGSPIVAMEKIKDHYYANNQSCPNMKVWFNDKDKSKIETDKFKIERVKERCSTIFKPNNVEVEYSKDDYSDLYPKIVSRIRDLENEKLLLFIDPYGYKQVQPSHLKEFLIGGKSEVILFLPASHMYRFANKSLSEDEFIGGLPLKEFLTPLFEINSTLKRSRSSTHFIEQLKIAFRVYLKREVIFVDTFSIERDRQNVYCLFFFTPNALGFEKMLETKWKLDEESGRGFKLNQVQGSLFSEVEVNDYENELQSYIQKSNECTNGDLYLFGLENGFLPKHTNQILKEIQKTRSGFKVLDLGGNPVRKGAFYISYKNYGKNPEKVVKFKFEK